MQILKKYGHFVFLLISLLIFHFSQVRHNGDLQRFSWDDAYILMSGAKSIFMQGKFGISEFHGVLVAITSPLYTGLISVFFDPDIRIYETNIRFLNLFFSYASIALTFLIIRKLFIGNEYKTLIAFLASAFLAYHGQLSFIAHTGMETALFVFLFLWSVFAQQFRMISPLVALLHVLLIFTRPEAAVFPALTIMIYYWYHRKYGIVWNTKKTGVYVAIVASCSIAYSMIYFYYTGFVTPNTVSAKYYYFGIGCKSFWEKMNHFNFSLSAYISTCTSLFALAIAGLLYKGSYKIRLFLLGYIVVHSAALFVFMPDAPVAYNGRYFILVFVSLILLAAYGVAFLIGLVEKMSYKQYYVYIFLFFILITTLYSMKSEKKRLKNFHKEASLHHERLWNQAIYIKNNTKSDSIISTTDLGIVNYASGRHIIDLVGLANPEAMVYYRDASGQCIPNEKRDLSLVIKRFGLSFLLVARPWDRLYMGDYILKLGDRLQLIDHSAYDLYRVVKKENQ